MLQKNPMRLLDSKDPVIQALLADAPQIIDYLDDVSKQHFQEVVGYLDEVEVEFVLNPRLVRAEQSKALNPKAAHQSLLVRLGLGGGQIQSTNLG